VYDKGTALEVSPATEKIVCTSPTNSTNTKHQSSTNTMATNTTDQSTWAPGAKKIDAGDIAKPFREEIRNQVAKLKQAGIDAPLLVGLLANTDPAAKKYAEWTGKACRADGIRYELRMIDDPIDVEAALCDANDDPRVHGIIVYYPIFGQVESFSGESQDDYLRDTVSHKCDVEGLCHQYRSNLYRNVRYMDRNHTKKCVLPCTALSVVKILESCESCYDKSKPIGRHMEGQTVTIINRSEIVGRPLAAMLANDGADVYSIDIDSIYLFRGGKLHKCEGETPESCVRKVRD
jgi:methylenetetrahydrofolate dehydrogenase (NAD+)